MENLTKVLGPTGGGALAVAVVVALVLLRGRMCQNGGPIRAAPDTIER